MARAFTQAQLIQSIRDEGNFNPGPNGFISDAMLATWINQGISALQAKMVGANEDYFLKTIGAIAMTSGQSIYNLPWDAWKGRGIDVSTDPNFVSDVNTARPFNWKQRNMYNTAMGIYSFLGSTNLRYKFLPGTPLQIKFIPPNAPGNLNVQVWYLPEAPILVATMPGAYNTGTPTAVTLNQLVKVTLNGVAQVFSCMVPGTTGGSPVWNVPGVTADGGTVVWAYVGPLSLYTQVWDGFNGWEEYVNCYAALKGQDKQQKDTNVMQGRLALLEARILEETRNVDEDESDFIVDSYYQDGNTGGLGGFGGGWFG